MDDLRGLWRGKTTPKKNGEQFNNVWVEGDLIHSGNRYYIHPLTNVVKVQNELGRFIVMHEIAPSTLSECTGLRDKNGKLIFEGDIIKYFPRRDDFEEIGDIRWDKIRAGFVIKLLDGAEDGFCKVTSTLLLCEVIGNIHDNPELLELEVSNENT